MGKPRIVRNMFSRSAIPLSAPSFNSNTTSTSLSDGFRKVDSTADSVRCFWQSSYAVVAGKRYGIRATIRNVSGNITRMYEKLAGTGAVTLVGSWAFTVPNGTGRAVIGAVFDCTVSGNLEWRWGINPDSARVCHPCSAEFGEFAISEIPSDQSVPAEYVFAFQSGVMSTSFAGKNVGGYIVDAAGAAYAYDKTDAILVMGDSFCNDTSDWPQVVEPVLRWQKVIYANGISGRTLLQAISDFPAQADLSALNYNGLQTYAAFPASVVRPGMVVIALGINDTNAAATFEQMQERFESMVALCFSSGVTRILVFDIPPWKNAPGWSAADEAVRQSYNAWIQTRIASDKRMRLFKISDVLKDGTDPELLAAAYDSGDHLHPNATGSAAIAAAITPYLMWGFGPWATCDATFPTSAQPCKSHALPIGVGKITVFPGVASASQIEEAK